MHFKLLKSIGKRIKKIKKKVMIVIFLIGMLIEGYVPIMEQHSFVTFLGT